ncbi:MAG: asparagine synthase (glutamine-hydrolyzing) [Pyrinomonadaceae bacterium]
MCGICGAIDLSRSDNAAALVRRMNRTMSHRGPDDEGYLSAGPLSLGMRRLSIIDLEGGHQPIFNEDGSVGAVLNGEIYNFQELRKQLTDRGHSFRTRADSEVVAHAYEEWGPECVDHLRGMFAFAVYDRRTSQEGGDGELSGRLFLARDRLGIKPLYYTNFGFEGDPAAHSSEFRYSNSENQNVFLFASEVRTLLASGIVPRRLSRAALESYLLFGSVSEPMTLIEGVLSLPPGHRMTIPLGSQTIAATPESYWNMAERGHGDWGTRGHGEAGTSRHGDGEKGRHGHAENIASNGHASKFDLVSAAHHVRELLEESVRQHLVADVPVGVFLSSGIDSTSIAALASREIPALHTFTVAFPETEFSEASIARRTAEKFGTTHQELMLGGDDLLARVGEAVGTLDQPSMDGINTYFVSWGARQAGLKVALSGLGGDEVFGGYSTFRRTPQYQKIAALGSGVPKGWRSAMATAFAGAGGASVRGDATRKLAALWDDAGSLPHPYFFGRALFTPTQVTELMKGDRTGHQDLPWWNWLAKNVEQANGRDAFTAVSWMETRSYLVSTLLRDTDSMSMAHSLEVRVPFLDHLLVEFVTDLPEKLKRPYGTPKGLLVAALRDLLPPEVVHQPKRGFTFPWAKWLQGPLKQVVEKGLAELSPDLQRILNREKTDKVWKSYLNGHTSWSRPWSLYVLNEWTKKHLG